jgi:hypothetical protein
MLFIEVGGLMKKVKKLSKVERLYILGIIDVLVACFAFFERVCYLSYISKYTDLYLDSDFYIPSIYNLNNLTFNTIIMVLIASLVCISIFKKDKVSLLLSTILTMIISSSVVINVVLEYVNNPVETIWSLIIVIALIIVWDVFTIDTYERQRSLIDKIM